MIYLLVAYLLALLLTLFVASWRTAIWAFGVQSLVAGLMLIRGDEFGSWSSRIEAFELIAIRAVLVPVFLAGILRKLKAEREFDTIPANFVIWTLALGVLITSYWFGQRLFPADLRASVHLGTAIAGVLTGLFILSNQVSPLGQMIGLLTMESGVVLTELFAAHEEHWWIQLALSVVFVWMMGLFWEFLRHFSELEMREEDPEGVRGGEREVL